MKLLLLLCPALALGQIQFQDVSAESGIDYVLENDASGRFRQPELMVGGVAAFDYDSDGCLDLYFTNGAALPSLKKTEARFHNRLYRSRCDGAFADTTEEAGVAGEGYSMAAATADFDNDGDADLFVAGVNRNILYRNDGDGGFTDVTAEAGLRGVDPRLGKLWSISAGWFDYDNDGWLDLFVSNYVQWDPRTEGRCGTKEHPLYCHPDNYRGQPNQLFRNNGDGTFGDVSRESGIAEHIGKGMGVAFGDHNADGRMDVFVANDSVRSFLFENLGGGQFQEVGLEYGVALREDGAAIAGMGADFRDYNNDGRPDIFVSGMINDTFLLFRNAGGEAPFDDYTIRSGVAIPTRQWTGWSVGMYDFDNDGWKDLFCANSHFPQLGRYLATNAKQTIGLLRNNGGAFADVSAEAGFDHKAFHRGAAFGDFDNDGRVDAVVTALDEKARLYRNVSAVKHHWLRVELQAKAGNRNALGARLSLELADGAKLFNHLTTSVGYASASEPAAHFGLGSHPGPATLTILWPDGSQQTREIEQTNQTLVIQQETDELERER